MLLCSVLIPTARIADAPPGQHRQAQGESKVASEEDIAYLDLA